MTTASSGEPGRDESPAQDPSGSQSPPPQIVRPVSPPEIRAYSQWLNDCVRAELRRVRLERGVTPYGLAVPGLLNKQTIANIENGVHSPTLVTLAIVSLRLGTRAEALVTEGTRRQPYPGDGKFSGLTGSRVFCCNRRIRHPRPRCASRSPPHSPETPPRGSSPRIGLPHAKRGRPRIAQGPPCLVHGPPCFVRGRPCLVRGPPCLVHGRPCFVHGRPCFAHGPPRFVHGRPCFARGRPCFARGRPCPLRGPPGRGEGTPRRPQGTPRKPQGTPRRPQGTPRNASRPTRWRTDSDFHAVGRQLLGSGTLGHNAPGPDSDTKPKPTEKTP